jgi:serine/threonine protein kinase/tetratricopeptide (TPR) repeat protein
VNTPTPARLPLTDNPPTVRNFVVGGSAVTSVSTPAPITAGKTTLPAPPALPEVGTEFLGFQLVRELGRGAFGRVYLATQPELAGRAVALKVSVDIAGESRSLAQLQHTNIVPVYSVHHDRGLHAVCMPYFGRTTLADVLRHRRRERAAPASGAALVELLRGWKAESVGSDTQTRKPAVFAPPPTAPPPTAQQTDAVYDRLTRLTFPQAVCWMTARVADGLAHAHDRGIVHRDVKPANVLLTDDGQPMLLDFGVAADLNARTAADAAGGTVPYMAPEQLAGLFAVAPTADPRSDVYALGVILFEWLTGVHPFSPPAGELEADLPRLLDERRRWVPRVRALLPDVPPDLEAIVRKCVTADLARRYQSAADLSEDLRRHLDNEPLRTAAEPGGLWRLVKWRKRHPKLGGQLLAVVGVLAGLGLCGGAALAWRGLEQAGAEQAVRAAETARERERLDATRRLAELRAELRTARYLLAGRVNELRAVPPDLHRLRNALHGYGLPDDGGWADNPAVTALPDRQRDELRVALSDACLLLARNSLQAEAGGREAARAGERFNHLAEAVRAGPIPQAVYSQRVRILIRLDRPAEAREMTALAAATPLQTAEDHFLAADERLADGSPADAAPLFRQAVRLDPTHFWAQFQLGVCQQLLGRPNEARACYSAAVALRPDLSWAYFNRAMATVPLQNNAEVIADLDSVLALEPTHAPALLHRAHALALSGERAKALADLDAVLAAPDPGGMHVRALLQRAKLKKQDGDHTGAAADTAAALPLTPADEVGWLMRGLAQAEADPAAALADIQQAVKLNPQYVTALRNQVYVLEKLKRYDDAAGVMERVIALAPNDMLLRGSRGVLYARLGKTEAAVSDLTHALGRSPTKPVRVIAATGYAVLCRQKAEFKAQVIQLLIELKEEGVPLADLRTEPEFDALRDDPDFLRLTAK